MTEMGNLNLFPPEDESVDEVDAALGDSSPAAEVVVPEAWTPSQLNRALRLLLESSFRSIWVAGEVTNFKRVRSGHCYFTLRDDEAQVRCVMFRADAAKLPTDPDEGMKVRALGAVTVYEARGDCQLVVRTLEGEGAEGLWRLAFEKLRILLEGEGLLARERKRAIPEFPSCVGVATSPTGAAIRDILSVIARRAPWVRVVVKATRVQGEGAALEVAEAIRSLGASGLVDVVIASRGGGSIEDLWAFNEEPVARAIAECPVPVISAVGHEVDVTIADLVADLRAPTPSVGAEAAVPDREAITARLVGAPTRLARGLRGAVRVRRTLLDDRRGRLVRALPLLVAPRREVLRTLSERSARLVARMIEAHRARLQVASGTMTALSPLATLSRGYAVPLTSDGAVLRRTSDFSEDLEFSLRVVDGHVECSASGTTPSEEVGA